MIKLTAHALAFACAFSALSAHAVLVRSGFFSGMDMVPMQGTTMRQIEDEPAAVLLFKPEAGTVEVTAQFDRWFSDPARPKINAYAVSIGPEETPFDVMAEVLRQRELKVPTFHIRGGNLLQGQEYRLLLLDNGGQVRKAFEKLDMPALEQELGVRREAPVAAASADPAAATSTVTTVTVTQVGVAPGEMSNVNEPLYRNSQFRMQVEFPTGWTYRVAKSNDGAVAKAPNGQLDLRVWALPNDVAPNGAPGSMTAIEYIDEFLSGIGEMNKTRVSVDRRLIVEDDEAKGRDYVYSYNKLIEPDNPAAGVVRHRGRIQVFDHDGFIKACGADGPAREFDALDQSLIESYFLTFHPKLETEPAPAAADLGQPATAAPPVRVEPARPASRTRFY